MTIVKEENINEVIDHLFEDSKYDHLKLFKAASKSVFGGFKPSNFKDVYLSISREQGEDLRTLIIEKNVKNIVEFGTSFGISTLFLAQGILETGGHIITTELIESKVKKASENFQRAGVNDLIEVRTGDAMETLKDHDSSIDLLLLDGWKDLYLPLFQMLEPNFHEGSIIYVDNADMADTQAFLKTVASNNRYNLQSLYSGKVILITLK
ncbi:MAG: O-methyltransferase [Jejuia sp.]